jgi:hypothetical protein
MIECALKQIEGVKMYSDMISKYKKAVQEVSASSQRKRRYFSGVKIPYLIPTLLRIIRQKKQCAQTQKIKQRINTYWV